MFKKSVFLYISAFCYIYTNYIFLDTTHNTDSHSKISAGGNDFEKKKDFLNDSINLLMQ